MAAIGSSIFARAAATLSKTALHNFHVSTLGAKMIPFAGYSMPLVYEGQGQVASHLWTRESASLFDVSHMGQLMVHGPDRVAFMERCCVADLESLPPGASCLSVITTSDGGILDDCLITNAGRCLFVVLNAGNKARVMTHLEARRFAAGQSAFDQSQPLFDASLESWSTRSLLAVQGPKSGLALQRFMPDGFDLKRMPFMTSTLGDVAGGGNGHVKWGGGQHEVVVSRCGYTGEDGFELSMCDTAAVAVVTQLLQEPEVKAAGLAARNSLRLEAGLCLHGHDIVDETTPAEGGLAWCVSKARRSGARANFIGADVVLRQLGGTNAEQPVQRKRVGLTVVQENCPPVREGTKLFAADGETPVGTITSGGSAPSLNGTAIAMGMVKRGYFRAGTQLKALKNKSLVDVVVTAMPFVPSKVRPKW